MKSLNLTPEQKKEAFGEGPWVDEPDYLEFDHEGYKCFIDRKYHGAYCGYVEIPKDHPWTKLERDNINSHVHGGITLQQEQDNHFLIGFDCVHGGDLAPRFKLNEDRLKKSIEYKELFRCEDFPFLLDIYRDMDYVIEECKKLAMEVKAAEKKRKKKE